LFQASKRKLPDPGTSQSGSSTSKAIKPEPGQAPAKKAKREVIDLDL